MLKSCRILFYLSLLFVLVACDRVVEVDHETFEALRYHTRVGEQFRYMGSKDGYDFFVGEQWVTKVYPQQKWETERYYRLKGAKFELNRFDLTKDREKWRKLR